LVPNFTHVSLDTPPSCRIFSHVEIPTGRTDRGTLE
jgi:hypothetical protein